MQGLDDSSRIADDRTALRRKLYADGYLFFRDLVDGDVIRDLAMQTYSALRCHNWFEPGQARQLAMPPHVGENGRSPHGDSGYEAAVALEGFQRLSYDRDLTHLVRTLIGDDAFPLPSWARPTENCPYPSRASVLRTVYPQSKVPEHNGMYEHQDYGAFGVQDMFTAWIPLMAIDSCIGGLALRPGEHANGLIERRMAQFDNSWATTDYEVGDVLVFHALTPHAALPNRGERLRLSVDTRYQSTRAPLISAFAYGIRGDPRFTDDPVTHYAWWEPVPDTVHVIDHELFQPAPPLTASAFVPVPGYPNPAAFD